MILVFGASGKVGSELVQQLLKINQPVRAFTRDSSKLAHLGNRVEIATGSLDQPESLDVAMQGVERVFLVTADTQQDINVITAAKKAGVRHIVKLSTLEAEAARIQIGKWHREREQLIEASGLAWTHLRPSMFMSNSVEWWGASIKRQGAVFFPGGKGKVAPVAPADVAAVALAALTQSGHEGKAYALTGTQLLTIGDMVQIIGSVLGKRIRYMNIPPFIAKIFMLRFGMDKTLVNAIMEIVSVLRKNEASVMNDTVERVTGRPVQCFDAWCREHIAAFQ